MIIRDFQEKDSKHILNLSSRFNEAELMEYRNHEVMNKKQIELAEKSILNNKSNIFVVEHEEEFLGYLEMTKENDYFTNKPIGYISAIAVTSSSEGKGVGKLLMKKAETWCAENQCTELVLDVFKANQNAIMFYRHLGFEEEIVKMVKILKQT